MKRIVQLLVTFAALAHPLVIYAAPVFETVYSFALRPSVPVGALHLHTDGNYYGTTYSGGTEDVGTIYRVSPTNELTMLASMPRTSAHPSSGLIPGDGSLWGITQNGGVAGRGTLYTLDPETRTLTTAVSFTGTTGSAKGARPCGELLDDGAGSLWGTTIQGGTYGYGTIFKFNLNTKEFTTVFAFTGTATGTSPNGSLVADGDGFLWGTTQSGGTYFGTVFKINAADGGFVLSQISQGDRGCRWVDNHVRV